jgi:Ca2+-transporting ATPase
MARSTPSDKYLLVSRLRALGEVVAVTGDGTNDAPALKEADVGLSMGLSGTEVAKEASDIVILDDNFSSIVKAVLWGRSVYENIRKFLQFQLTVNIVALTVVFVGALAQRDLPLTAVQLLWINLIMDTFAALALATEPPSPELLERKPYGRYDPLITSVMMRNIIAQAIWQIAVVLTIMFAGPGIMGIAEDSVVITSMSFNSFVWCQMFNEFNARRIGDNDGPFTNIFGNLTPMKSPLFFAIWVGTAGVQAILIEFGGSAVQTTGLTAAQWWVCIALGVGSLPIGVISRCIPVPARKASIPKDVLEMRERALRGEPKTEEMKELVTSDSKDGESSSARKSDGTTAGGESSPRHHNSQPKVKTVARTQSDIVEAAPMLESEDKKEEEAADRS